MTMPSEAERGDPNLFDRFADAAHQFVSRAWFFALCVLMILIWLPSFPLFEDLEKWQLPINTTTTIVTFLLVALLENKSKRGDDATQHKLNAIAAHAIGDASDAELRSAVGLEDKESS